jgi:transposase-like protein
MARLATIGSDQVQTNGPKEVKTMPHETVSFDEPKLQDYLGELVRKTVQDSLNALLDKEANQIVNAGRYERQACCSGHYRQNLTTTLRDVTLSV